MKNPSLGMFQGFVLMILPPPPDNRWRIGVVTNHVLTCMRSNSCLPFFSRSVVFVVCTANLLTVNAVVKQIPPLRKTS